VSLYLGIDVGTQSTKALVFNVENSQVVSKGKCSYGLDSNKNGGAEQHPSVWIDGVNKAVSEALKGSGNRSKIKGIGVSGQQHGFVALDSKNDVIRPAKLWCDTETEREAEHLSNIVGKEISVRFTASKILWMKRKEPENFSRLDTVLLPHDYINFYLTGEKTMEAGDASGTGFFDIQKRTFDNDAINAIDSELHSKIPSLVNQFEPIGKIRKDISDLFGIGRDVIVSPGSGDNMMSAIGSGAIEEGVFVISLGTSGTVFCHSSKTIGESDADIAAFCDAVGGWLPLFCLTECTLKTEELVARFNLSHDQLIQLATQENTKSPEGVIYKRTIEKLTNHLYEGFQKICSRGPEPNEIRIVGGGAKNNLWSQMIANTFRSDVSVLSEFDTAALGGAIQASLVDGYLNSHKGLLRKNVKPEN